MKDRDEIELEDIQDQAEHVGYLTPREYGKLRSITAQLVYYYIRTGLIKDERCKCGRRIISVQAADEALAQRARAREGQPDTRSDTERQKGT